MRIVGGRLRGRRLVEPKSQEIRPTTDRNRESLFNVLAHRWPEKLDNSRVLDVFAGTGALGCEAVSRGAAFAVFIEQGAEGRGLLRQNIQSLGLTGHSKVFRRDATKPGPIGTMSPFDLIFADPPYGRGLGELAATALAENGWLKPNALLVLEEASDSFPAQLPHFEKVYEKRAGLTDFGFFEYLE